MSAVKDGSGAEERKAPGDRGTALRAVSGYHVHHAVFPSAGDVLFQSVQKLAEKDLLGKLGIRVAKRPHIDRRFCKNATRRLDLHSVPSVFINSLGTPHHGAQSLEIVDPTVLPGFRPVADETRRTLPKGGVLRPAPI